MGALKQKRVIRSHYRRKALSPRHAATIAFSLIRSMTSMSLPLTGSMACIDKEGVGPVRALQPDIMCCREGLGIGDIGVVYFCAGFEKERKPVTICAYPFLSFFLRQFLFAPCAAAHPRIRWGDFFRRSSVEPLGHGFLTFSSMFQIYHTVDPLWIQVLRILAKCQSGLGPLPWNRSLFSSGTAIAAISKQALKLLVDNGPHGEETGQPAYRVGDGLRQKHALYAKTDGGQH